MNKISRTLVAAALVVAPIAMGAPSARAEASALAQEPAEVFHCSDFIPGATGVIVFGPLGPDGRNVNANCTMPGPSGGGGAAVIECSSFGPYKGNFVVPPSGHAEGHCQ